MEQSDRHGSPRLSQKAGEVFVPSGRTPGEALSSTTHLGIGAHPDDLELMAWHGILSCYGKAERGFTGVVVTDGAGSPRSGRYAEYSAEAMRLARLAEQKQAAGLGQYAALVCLGFASDAIKTAHTPALVEDFNAILRATRPDYVYTHNLFDAHDTHLAVVVHLIRALRDLPAAERPKAVYGCEVWRSLDWLPEADKILLDVSGHDDLAMALVRAHDSQISGGKRYDLAALGRRHANATYSDARHVDQGTAVEIALDLMPLVRDPSLDIHTFVKSVLQRFGDAVTQPLARLVR